MSVQVENLEHNMAKLTIEVAAEELEKALDSAYQKQKKQISVPGFRKGKVPRAMIEKMYGAGVFYEDAANILMQQTYAGAVDESGVDIVSRPTVEVTQIEKGQPFIYTAEVAVRPEVTLGKYMGVTVTKIDTSVSDEEVDAELENQRNKNARTVTVTDRPVAEGDTAVIDFEGFVDGVAFDGGKGENHPLEIGSHTFIDTFEDQLVGKNTGDEVEVNVTFPEQYQAADLAGKPATFKVKINEIKAKELPELDDEFAQDVSEFDTLDEYKADLKKQISEKKEADAKTDMENQLLEQITDNMEAEIPECMFAKRCDEMVQDYSYRLQMQGLDLNTYLQYLGQDMDSFKETFKEAAEKQVKVSVALRAIIEAEKIEATDEDIDKEAAKIGEQYGMDAEQVKKAIPAEQLAEDVKRNKAVDMIVEAAVIE